MKRSFPLALILAVALAVPAGAAAYTSPTWNLNGTYTVNFVETVGPDGPGPYPYSVTITTTSDSTGAVTGTGTYQVDGVTTVAVTGQATGWDVALTLTYGTPYLAYNPFLLVGKIDQQGGMSGTATDGQNREFTWSTVTGRVGLYTDRCDYGTYAGYEQVWSGFAPATGAPVGPIGALPVGYRYFVEASGTYFAGGNGLYDIQADAEYSQDAIQRAATPTGAWTDSVHNYESYGAALLDLKVNGSAVSWGAYNAGHRYTLPVGTGGAITISTSIYDLPAAYYNNTGGLCVAVYADKVPDGEILSPTEGASFAVGDSVEFRGNYHDDDPGGAVSYAVRVDPNTSCSFVSGDQYWGNVNGDSDPYTWTTIADGKQFLSTAVTTGWPEGTYCFVFNPGGSDNMPPTPADSMRLPTEANIRLTSRFTLTAPADTTNPVITFVDQTPAANSAGWNTGDVTLNWSCTDAGSGVVDATVSKVVTGEGSNLGDTGTCADNEGNTASDTQSGVKIDRTAPGIDWAGSIADGVSFPFGSVPAEPTCAATDALSGPGTCVVTGYSTAKGTHTLTATAYDLAGNQTVQTRDYTVAAWTLNGFYAPVDMNSVNVIKGGQTVPLKFEVFAGDTELTSTAAVKSFTTQKVACTSLAGEPLDEIDFVTTGGTSLRYDATGGQFIQNWQTPKGAGICYKATMTTQDGSSLVAFFKTK